MSDDVIIRAATLDDFTGAAHLDRDEMGAEEGYPLYFFRQAFGLFGDGFLVAVRNDEVLGYLLVGRRVDDPKTVEIYSIVVDKATRGQGVGRKLTAAGIAWAQERAAGRVVLTVEPTNAAARAVYESLGFETERAYEDYYGDGTPRLFMTRSGAASAGSRE
ncbi:MAG: GNAT family N-acetyltransferase [Maricaulaceae bacterium]|jgi:ribosomal-protein-alanine N-acetyltransferase